MRDVVIIWHFHHKHFKRWPACNSFGSQLPPNWHDRVFVLVLIDNNNQKTFLFPIIFVFLFCYGWWVFDLFAGKSTIGFLFDCSTTPRPCNQLRMMWKIIDFVSAFHLNCMWEMCVAIDRTTPNMWHTRNSCVKHFVVINSEHNWCDCVQSGISELEFIYLEIFLLSIIQQGIDQNSICDCHRARVWNKATAPSWITDAKRRPHRTPGQRHPSIRQDGKVSTICFFVVVVTDVGRD